MLSQQHREFGENINRRSASVEEQCRTLIHRLRQDDITQDYKPVLEAVTDVLDKFALWSRSMGALSEPSCDLSLDYGLSDLPDVRVEVLRQLAEISEAFYERENYLDELTWFMAHQTFSFLRDTKQFKLGRHIT
ncbi:hypothetical protein FOBRF1_006797 [Fusarium oxysporum]